MDTAQWAQVSSTYTNNINNGTRPPPLPPQQQQQQQQQQPQLVEKRTRPLKELAINCPRCKSTNTKFCYYNNYSLSQPRYFCKTCRRYWTEGGTLRNVPVGGGSRKNKKHSSSNKANNYQPTNSVIPSTSLMSKPSYQGQDLNLGFENNNMMLPQLFGASFSNNNFENNSSGGLSAMELLRSTTSAMYGSGAIQNYGVSDHHIKFPLNGVHDGMHNLFPFGDMKQVNMKSINDINERINKGQGEEQAILSFWNGVENAGGGGGSW